MMCSSGSLGSPPVGSSVGSARTLGRRHIILPERLQMCCRYIQPWALKPYAQGSASHIASQQTSRSQGSCWYVCGRSSPPGNNPHACDAPHTTCLSSCLVGCLAKALVRLRAQHHHSPVAMALSHPALTASPTLSQLLSMLPSFGSMRYEVSGMCEVCTTCKLPCPQDMHTSLP